MIRALILSACFLTGCASDPLIHEIRLLSFETNVGKGKSLGEVRGEVCGNQFLGLWLGHKPDIQGALEHLRNSVVPKVEQTSGSAAVSATNHIRYLNNITVTETGADVLGFGRKCLQITGLGFL